jgi:hypothetical protein
MLKNIALGLMGSALLIMTAFSKQYNRLVEEESFVTGCVYSQAVALGGENFNELQPLVVKFCNLLYEEYITPPSKDSK